MTITAANFKEQIQVMKRKRQTTRFQCFPMYATEPIAASGGTAAPAEEVREKTKQPDEDEAEASLDWYW